MQYYIASLLGILISCLYCLLVLFTYVKSLRNQMYGVFNAKRKYSFSLSLFSKCISCDNATKHGISSTVKLELNKHCFHSVTTTLDL